MAGWYAPRCHAWRPMAGWSVRKAAATVFIALRASGHRTFEAATRHIYDPPPSDWSGRFELLLSSARQEPRRFPRGAEKCRIRQSASGRLGSTLGRARSRRRPLSAIRLEVSAEDASGRRLLPKAGHSIAPADAYLKFMKSFEPLRGWLGRRARLSEPEAFTARVLLIHHYRRVVLRDPLLPSALLPADWPGRAARELCGEIYRGLLPASEQWLDRHASNEGGPLPAPGVELGRRFG